VVRKIYIPNTEGKCNIKTRWGGKKGEKRTGFSPTGENISKKEVSITIIGGEKRQEGKFNIGSGGGKKKNLPNRGNANGMKSIKKKKCPCAFPLAKKKKPAAEIGKKTSQLSGGVGVLKEREFQPGKKKRGTPHPLTARGT